MWPVARSASKPALQGGFTLLEVLVALVIIGVALSASMRGIMSLTGTAEDTRMKLLGTMAAENRIVELRLSRQRLEPGQITNTCAQGGVEFLCEQFVKPTPNPFFRRVEIRVRRPDNPDRVSAEMMTVLPTGG